MRTTSQNFYIAAPMRPECRLAVLIPVFDETVDTILASLTSLVQQEGMDKGEFEVVYIISNTKAAAEARTREFLQNQVAVEFLKYVNGTVKTCAVGLSSEQEEAIKSIRASGLVVHVIDKASPAAAEHCDSANIARDFAGSEICRRFASTDAGENGVIALTDCDCRFSPNYAAELIKTFADYPEVNRVAGKWLTEADPALPDGELLEKAYALHIGADTSFKNYRPPQSRLKLVFQKRDRRGKMIAVCGQNTAIRVRAWLEAGGIGHRYSFDDILFGYRVSHLRGETVFNPNFWVASLLRVSERTGIIAQGRRIKLIHGSIQDFLDRRTSHMRIPDIQAMVQLGHKVFLKLQQDRLDADELHNLLSLHGFDMTYLALGDIQQLSVMLLEEFGSLPAKNRTSKAEELLLEKFFRALPHKIYEFGDKGAFVL